MVNADTVNARPSCSIHAHFCNFFAVSGRFPRFKNPVKYIGSSLINHAALREVSTLPYFIATYQ
jgi:hypothetical protein